jgi:hypothetical protein
VKINKSFNFFMKNFLLISSVTTLKKLNITMNCLYNSMHWNKKNVLFHFILWICRDVFHVQIVNRNLIIIRCFTFLNFS